MEAVHDGCLVRGVSTSTVADTLTISESHTGREQEATIVRFSGNLQHGRCFPRG
jgi:hypothetical protein